MNEKLKKLALKLSVKYKSSTVNEAYKQFMQEVSANMDYFGFYTPEQLVKIPIYIYSKIETGGFEYGDGMIKNAWIGNIFEISRDDFATETCDECDGNGYIACDDCDNGDADCSHCDSGKVECDACGGDGDDGDGDSCDECNGNGEVNCDWCDGQGTVSCSNCGGDGSHDCPDCDAGEVETSRLKYINTTIIVWDKDLINMFMNSYELQKPTFKQNLYPFINEGMMSYLEQTEEDAEFKNEVKPDKIYCFYFEKFLQGGLELFDNEITTARKPLEYIYR